MADRGRLGGDNAVGRKDGGAMQQIWTPVKKVTEATYGAFGPGTFGKRAEAFARYFGTPQFLIGQTVLVLLWIAVNVVAVAYQWDPYPFILLNLLFSLQAAYAAPLILLAQTRQADRDREVYEADLHQRSAIAEATLRHQDEMIETLARLEQRLVHQSALVEAIGGTATDG